MFCQKCGYKLEENIAFCPKCGERQPVADGVGQSTGNSAASDGKNAGETVPRIQTATEAYELLKENEALCPEIKATVLGEYHNVAVVVAVGKVYRYHVEVMHDKIRINASPKFPYVIPYVLSVLSVVLMMVVSCAYEYYRWWYGVELVELSISFFGLLSALYGIGVSVFGNKEKKNVLPFIRKVLGQSKYVEPPLYFEVILFSVLAFLHICLMVGFGLMF